MTSIEAKQLERATIRAQRDALEVLGRGSTRDGRAVYAVPSRRDVNHWHLVVVSPDGRRLSCTCEAGRYSKVICAHRAATRARILADRMAAERAAHERRTIEAAARGVRAAQEELASWYRDFLATEHPAPDYY